jgi:hypothetical protein
MLVVVTQRCFVILMLLHHALLSRYCVHFDAQRRMFCDLQALLQCKLEAKQRARAEQQRGGRAGVNQQDEAYLKAMDAQVV